MMKGRLRKLGLRKVALPFLHQSRLPTQLSTNLSGACYGVLRFVMESGAKGCEVIVSGKLRAQRAKAMKFKDGYMISSGQPVNEYIDSAVRHVLLRQGVLGIKVKIILDWDPKGKVGSITPLPDLVTIHSPKEEEDTTIRLHWRQVT
ncbi:hypothetical protein SO802_005011 [Lithocarpus litseifolius]|uniref:Small ribosomal subunit protein uS3 C-terminal domain-containing protein n=1 Tax=Lithocarpus litseifolius TaxID=425828 RepID=A0AAW2DGY6_9ROSI